MKSSYDFTVCRCLNCNYWKQWHDQKEARYIVGDCRKSEPQNFQVGETKFVTKWPSTRSTDFCGQFVPKS